MDLRTLTKLILKLVGLYLLVTGIVALPTAINLPKPYNIESTIFMGTYVLLGALLLWFPGGFINTVIRIPSSQFEGALTARKLLQVGCILLGVYFALTGALSFIHTYAQARWFYDVLKPFANSRGPDLSPGDFAQLMTAGIRFVLGLCLWLGSQYVVKASGAFRDDAK